MKPTMMALLIGEISSHVDLKFSGRAAGALRLVWRKG
jgi:hypothetical protein